MANVDFTKALQDYKNSQTLGQQSYRRYGNAGSGTAIAQALAGYLSGKGMNQAQHRMGVADQAEQDERSLDMARILGAYREDTPYNQSDDETFPGQPPIQGLTNEGTGQNVNAMAQAMMGAQGKELNAAGLALAAREPAHRMGKYNPGDFTPESWARFIAAGGGDASASVLERYEPPWVGKVGNVPSLVSRSGATPGAATPLTTIKEEAENAAIVSGASEGAKLKQQQLWKPKIEADVALAKAEATEKGEVLTDYNRAKAAMPGLLESVGELKELAAIATSTIGGKVWDVAVKETGFGSTKGASAKAKFVAIINNQVLPLLRPTFGAAFTVAEGESLKNTMGDPDATPDEKIMVLDAFIAQKYRTLEEKERQLGINPTDATPPTTDYSQEDLEFTAQKHGITVEEVKKRLGVK